MKSIFEQKQIGSIFFQIAINSADHYREAKDYFDFCILNVKNKKVGETARIIFMIKFYKLELDIVNKTNKLYFVFNFFGKVLANERYGL